MRAAACGVDDDLGFGARERIDVVASQLTGAFAVAGMRVQSSAARLFLWDAHDVALALEQADRRAPGFAEGLAHDASREQADVSAIAVDAAEGSAFGTGRERRCPPEPAR